MGGDGGDIIGLSFKPDRGISCGEWVLAFPRYSS
jgi:hypothetical protein